MNLLTSTSFLFFFLLPHIDAPSSPLHSPPPSVPQCVWLVAQTLSIRIALQRSSEEGGEKKQHISAICVKRSSFLSTHKETAPPQNVLTQQQIGPFYNTLTRYLLFHTRRFNLDVFDADRIVDSSVIRSKFKR